MLGGSSGALPEIIFGLFEDHCNFDAKAIAGEILTSFKKKMHDVLRKC